MADMTTRCPQCATAFRITAAHLKSAKGSVRCGACFTIFNALENLSERNATTSRASFDADDMLISDNMGLEDDNYDSPADSSGHSSFKTEKQSLCEQDAAQAKRAAEKVDADGSWALELLDDDEQHELNELPHSDAEDYIEQEPGFRAFVAATPQKIELSDDFLRATKQVHEKLTASTLVPSPTPLPTPSSSAAPPATPLSEQTSAAFDAPKPVLANILKPNAEQQFVSWSAAPESTSTSVVATEHLSNTPSLHPSLAPKTGLLQELASAYPELDLQALGALQADLMPLATISTATAALSDARAPAISVSTVSAAPVTAAKPLTGVAARPTALTQNARLIDAIQPEALEVSWRPTRRRWSGLWGLGCLAAITALVVQVAVLQFSAWRYQAPYAEFYRQACGWLSCPSEQRIDLNKIATSNLLVHTHPSQTNALVVDAMLVNKAEFQQNFPGLVLSFRNLQNQLLAERVFKPEDYLGGELSGQTQMPVKQSIHIALEIVDPGKDAVSYSLAVLQ